MNHRTRTACLAIVAALSSAALAGIPLPDGVVVGELRINGQLIPRTRSDVQVIARRLVGGSPSNEVGRYRMGGRAPIGDRFAVRVRMESLADGSQPAANALRAGESVRLFVQVGAGAEQPAGVDVAFPEPGLVLTRNIGSGPPPCPEDIDGDGTRGLSDLAVLLVHFGTPSGATHAQGDITGEGAVDLIDLATLLTAFGLPCP